MRQFLYSSSSFFWGIMCWSFLLSWEKNCKKINKKKYIQKTKTIEKKQKKKPSLSGAGLGFSSTRKSRGRTELYKALQTPPHDCRPRGHRNFVLCTDLIFVVFQEVLRHLLCKLHLKGGTDHVREGAGGGCGILLPVLISPDPPFFLSIFTAFVAIVSTR